MKEFQKVAVPQGPLLALAFGTVMFAIGVIADIAQERYARKQSTSKQNAQPQMTSPTDEAKLPITDAPKEPSPKTDERDEAKPPQNVLGDIFADLRSGMPSAELDAVIAKHTLGPDNLRFYVKKEHRPAEEGLPNGVDVETRLWQWCQDEGYLLRLGHDDDYSWVTTLSVTLYNNTVAHYIYRWHREVDYGCTTE
ncbi:MAG: hypothetical protein Q7R85_00990 [bacterium]|nr:hypothetical protein [bacterium]